MSLHPYQVEGAIWLASRRYGLLADEMGLGKTAQAIAACDLIGAEKILVVCPASLRENWRREFAKFSGRTIRVAVLGGSEPMNDNVAVCSYEFATRAKNVLSAISWDVLIVDEGHYCKTPDTARTKAVLGRYGLAHKARNVYVLTGTPAPNNVGEMWPVLRTFGATDLRYGDFLQRYCVGYDREHGFRVVGNRESALPELRRSIESVMLRRMKREVLKDLPPIRFSDITVEGKLPELTVEQTRELEAIKAVIEGDGENLQFLNAPQIRRLVGLAKVTPTMELAKGMLDGGLDKLVIFAYHRDVIETLRLAFECYGVVCVHGGSSPKARETAVSDFQTLPATKVFIGQMTAAGTGLTLTAASRMLIVEPSWTPAENAQAAMRIHRIGQRESCMVQFVKLANSIDEQITDALQRKTKMLAELSLL